MSFMTCFVYSFDIHLHGTELTAVFRSHRRPIVAIHRDLFYLETAKSFLSCADLLILHWELQCTHCSARDSDAAVHSLQR